jgi:hypothetical protein
MGKYTASVEDHLVLPARVRLPPDEERWLGGSGGRVPTPVPIRLLIDTGSRRTTLIPGIVRHLSPTTGCDARIITPLATGDTALYWVRLEFPGTGLPSIPEVLVARLGMPPGLIRFHGLLGRDLLSRLESFEYLGRRGRYTLRDTPGLFGWLRRWL